MAYYLASQLCNLGMNVKIIERNRERCEELCELLPKATIINGDATEHDLLIVCFQAECIQGDRKDQ